MTDLNAAIRALAGALAAAPAGSDTGAFVCIDPAHLRTVLAALTVPAEYQAIVEAADSQLRADPVNVKAIRQRGDRLDYLNASELLYLAVGAVRALSAERDALRGTVEGVEALADRWDDEARDLSMSIDQCVRSTNRGELRAALAAAHGKGGGE